MFRKNDSHRQQSFLDGVNELPERQQERLEASWSQTFYQDVFSRIDERVYEVLYSSVASRPNIAVNILVSLELLKAGFGWSDEEMYEQYSYNLQVRHALGIRDLHSHHFELRTMYNFRRRLSEHMGRTGENLLEQTFEQVTGEQLSAYEIKVQRQRVDSTQVSSNIRELSRLQLLVELLQQVYKMLDEVDRADRSSAFASYMSGSSGQFTYRLKGSGAYQTALEEIGRLMNRLVAELEGTYGNHESYQLLVRVFGEHYTCRAEGSPIPKKGSELSARSVQSPHDPEATYRSKRGEGHVGYVVNVTESSHAENPFQLIVKVQTEPNSCDDGVMLAEILPELIEKYDLNVLYTDGTYSNAEIDRQMSACGATQYQTAVRGRTPSGTGLDLTACQLTLDPQTQQLTGVTTPEGVQLIVEPGRKPGRYILRYPQDETLIKHTPSQTEPVSTDINSDDSPSLTEPVSTDSDTPSQTEPVSTDKSSSTQPDTPKKTTFYLSQEQLNVILRRQRVELSKPDGKNPRAAVEATIAAIKRPFKDDQLPVRGKFRTAMMIIGAATMVNFRRIHRFQQQQSPQNTLPHFYPYTNYSSFTQFYQILASLFRIPTPSHYSMI